MILNKRHVLHEEAYFLNVNRSNRYSLCVDCKGKRMKQDEKKNARWSDGLRKILSVVSVGAQGCVIQCNKVKTPK